MNDHFLASLLVWGFVLATAFLAALIVVKLFVPELQHLESGL